MHLYLDTTHGINLGIIDKDLKWLEYKVIEDAKSSAVLHSEINELLEKYKQDALKLDSLVYCAGPGSYTGMRVSEGLAQIFEMSGVRLYSFYHFEVPKVYGHESGVWADLAFKGETFLYHWTEDSAESSRVTTKELNLQQENLFSFSSEFEGVKANSTALMIKDNPALLLKKLLTESSSNRELYYYRELSEEFRRG